ncbi:hypothetical protein CBS147354_7436 [Penicillium roqueforti]|nr:hypothetical protein CBS147354_7436 [Penicillium roqueforti]
MGYYEFRCHLCGVSFNVFFRLRSGELDLSDPQDGRFFEPDPLDSKVYDDMVEDLDYQPPKDIGDNDPYEYDSDYESTDSMSLDGEDARDNGDSEDSSTDTNQDPERKMYDHWVWQTFKRPGLTDDLLRVGFLDNPTGGYSVDAISPEQASGCRTAQFLVHNSLQRDTWKSDELHEPWEIDGDWSLSGICDGAPMDPIVFPKRNGLEYFEADDTFISNIPPNEIAMPFHPWCFDIFCRQSKVQFQCINASGLMTWRNSEFDYDSRDSFPRCKEVRSSQKQWWFHQPGTEYLIANPLDVPGLPEILLAAVENQESDASYDPSYEIESSQSPTKRPVPSHNSQADFLSVLPAEIRLMIIDYLDSSDIASLTVASKAFTELPNTVWYRLVRREMPWLWEAWDESECIHSPSMWTNMQTAELKSMIRLRKFYVEGLLVDWYTERDAEKAAEHRYPMTVTMPDQVKLPIRNTDWRRVLLQIQRNWDMLKGLQNRQRIWTDVEEIIRRIRKLDA